MSNLNSFFCLLLLSLLLLSTINDAKHREKLQINPTSTVFIFNFENIVAKHEIARTAWSSIAAIISHPWALLLLLKPSFYKDAVHSFMHNFYADGAYIWNISYYLSHFQKRHALFTPDLKEALLQSFNKYKPMTITLKIITALKKSGYCIYLFTHKDKISLLHYIKPYLQKYHKVNLDIFFDGYFYSNPQNNNLPPTIYKEIAKSLHKNEIKQLVFFDNNKINIQNAQQAHPCFTTFHISHHEDLEKNEIIHKALLMY